MKRIGTLNGKPIVQGNENEIKKNTILYKENNGKIELSERGNSGKIDNITQGSSNSSKDDGKVYIAFPSNKENEITPYIYLFEYIKYFIIFDVFKIIKGPQMIITVPDSSTKILVYAELNPVVYSYTNSSGSEIITTNSLEEYESVRGLDHNNRPFKIITKEEFDKDLTEEEARKIANELLK